MGTFLTLEERRKMSQSSNEMFGSLGSTIQIDRVNQPIEKKSEPKGFLGKSIDIISRPLYASANFSKDIIEGKGLKSAITSSFQGLSGKERNYYSDVLESAGVKNKYVRAVVGFGLDVLLDPVTYLSFGTAQGAKLGLTVLNKTGKKLLLESLEKQAPNIVKLNIVKGMTKHAAEVAARAAIESSVLKMALKEPAKYASENAIRLGGKKIPLVSDLYQMAGKKLNPAMEKFYQTRPMRTLGKAFIGESFLTKHAAGTSAYQKNFAELARQQFKSKVIRGGEQSFMKAIERLADQFLAKQRKTKWLPNFMNFD